ncbi:MAG: hypothetical protein JWM86_1561 [Thermoleophilia bacterium]|nr:hypothetical protein [Thermoleophilia bacterium]
MAIMGFNPAAEMSQLRNQQTLAMQASAPAAAAAAPADPAAAAAAGAAAPGAAADAAIGAQAVQAPPSTSKIVLQSVLKGAMTGASVTLGLKQFGPLLLKVPFLSKMLTPALGFLSKLPIVGKVLPMLGKAGIQGFLIAGLIGAGVGAIAGALGGLKKAKAAAAEYAEAMAAQQAQQPPAGDPVNAPAPEAAPAPAPAPVKPKYKSWIIARSGSTARTGGSMGHYTTRKGDTMAQLAKRFHTTPAEIKRLNPGIGSDVPVGTKLKLKRKVVPTATRWKG